ncbi:MAG: DUF2752 domain-containing protein [Candidatus Eisenbacteria sp.]|nr:DUF2752 domain-containing protein [Candidatus Eisenbacteria bacterium]
MAAEDRGLPLEARHRGARFAVIAASMLVMSYVLLMEPLQSYLPHCLFHSLTGHSCPSCGLTRSLHTLLHGDVRAAFGFHALGPGIGFALAALNIVLFWEVLLGRRLRLRIPQIPQRALLCVAVGLGLCLWVGAWAMKLNQESKDTRVDESKATHADESKTTHTDEITAKRTRWSRRSPSGQ